MHGFNTDEYRLSRFWILTLGYEADDGVGVVQRRVAVLPGVADAGSRCPVPVLGQHGPVQLHHVEGQPGLMLPLHRAPGVVLSAAQQCVRAHAGVELRGQNRIQQKRKKKRKREIQCVCHESFSVFCSSSETLPLGFIPQHFSS